MAAYLALLNHLKILDSIDTSYIDMATHAEARVPQLKTFFSYLVERLTWHKPSLLILDNLDKVLSAEVEVSAMGSSFRCLLKWHKARRLFSFTNAHRIVPNRLLAIE